MDDSSPTTTDLPQSLYDFNSRSAELGYREEEDQLELEEAEIEMYIQMDLDSLFTLSTPHHSEQQNFFSSSSSSHRSLSIESPENSSLINNSSGSSLPDTPTVFLPSHQRAHSNNTFTKFPNFKNEDLVIAEAISEIFSSSSSSTSTKYSPTFKSYNSLSRHSEFGNKEERTNGQKMIKDSISYLRKMNSMNNGGEEEQGTRMSSHVISERRRREKLNESFYELRMLLPPCCKKDKASVLCKAKDYLKILEAQIFELQKKNQMPQLHQIPTDENREDVSGLMGITTVQITEAFELVVGIQRVSLKITVRLECEFLELVLHALEYLKKRRAISLLSLDAKIYLVQKVVFTSATLVFDIKVTDWDEESFKEGMIYVVDIANMSQ